MSILLESQFLVQGSLAPALDADVAQVVVHPCARERCAPVAEAVRVRDRALAPAHASRIHAAPKTVACANDRSDGSSSAGAVSDAATAATRREV